MAPWNSNAVRIVESIAIFCVVLGLGIWILNSYQNRLKRDFESARSCEPDNMLAAFREAMENGEMDSAEFEKVRQVLSDRSGSNSGGNPNPSSAETGEKPEGKIASGDPVEESGDAGGAG